MPDDFIPAAERSSLIKDVTLHMLPKLIEDMLILMDVVPLVVPFNTSAQDFEDGTFARTLLHEAPAKLRTLHYVAGRQFYLIGESLLIPE